ncbi:hypothetical protein Droror1_Dr00027681 [Drosera rotundifolia]
MVSVGVAVRGFEVVVELINALVKHQTLLAMSVSSCTRFSRFDMRGVEGAVRGIAYMEMLNELMGSMENANLKDCGLDELGVGFFLFETVVGDQAVVRGKSALVSCWFRLELQPGKIDYAEVEVWVLLISIMVWCLVKSSGLKIWELRRKHIRC